VLAERGTPRRIRRVVPYFAAALHLAAISDEIVTVSETAARALADTLALRVWDPPLALPTYTVNLLWHPRLDAEPANQWLRDAFVRAASSLGGSRSAPRAPRRTRPAPALSHPATHR
jgi:DNA-binding transcriptional LysR family regulator